MTAALPSRSGPEGRGGSYLHALPRMAFDFDVPAWCRSSSCAPRSSNPPAGDDEIDPWFLVPHKGHNPGEIVVNTKTRSAAIRVVHAGDDGDDDDTNDDDDEDRDGGGEKADSHEAGVRHPPPRKGGSKLTNHTASSRSAALSKKKPDLPPPTVSKKRPPPAPSTQPAAKKPKQAVAAPKPKPPPAPKSRPNSSSSSSAEDAAIKALLKQHNQKHQPKATYVPALHSVKDVRSWELKTGKKWQALSAEEREAANADIAREKEKR